MSSPVKPTFPVAGPAPSAFPKAGTGVYRPLTAADATVGAAPEKDSWVDYRTGAPMAVRLAVASAGNETDKINTLKRFGYSDVAPTSDGNYEYTALRDDPAHGIQAGQRMVFDERQFSLRDVLGDVDKTLPVAAGALAGMGTTAAMGGTPAAFAAAPFAAGAAAGGTKWAVQKGLQTMLGTPDTRPFGEQAADIGTEAATNAVGQLAGDAFGLAGRGVRGVVKGIFGIKPVAAEVAEQAAAKAEGVPMGKALSSRNAVIGMIRSVLQKNPATIKTMTDAGADFSAGVEGLANKVSVQLAGKNPVDVAAFNQGIETASQGWLDRFKTTRKLFDDALLRFIPPDTRVPVPNVMAALTDLEQKVAQSPAIWGDRYASALAEMRKVVGDAQGGGVPFEALRDLRTDVGDAANWTSPMVRKTPQERMLSGVYQALKQDIQSAAKAAGPEAEEVLGIHDAYVTMARSQKQFVNVDTFEKLAQGNPSKDVDPLAWVRAHNKGGGELIESTLNNMLPEERRAFAGGIFEAMGRVPDENGTLPAWSMAKFAKSKKDMGPVFNKIFGQPEFRPAIPALQNLLTLIEPGVQAERLAKYKYTAISGLGLGLGGGALGAGLVVATVPVATGAAGVALSSYAAAKLLTNPAWVRAVSGMARAGGWTAKQGMRLEAMKKTEPQIADAIDEYLGVMQEMGAETQPIAAVSAMLNTGRPGVQYEYQP